jgi:hypothetical protein
MIDSWLLLDTNWKSHMDHPNHPSDMTLKWPFKVGGFQDGGRWSSWIFQNQCTVAFCTSTCTSLPNLDVVAQMVPEIFNNGQSKIAADRRSLNQSVNQCITRLGSQANHRRKASDSLIKGHPKVRSDRWLRWPVRDFLLVSCRNHTSICDHLSTGCIYLDEWSFHDHKWLLSRSTKVRDKCCIGLAAHSFLLVSNCNRGSTSHRFARMHEGEDRQTDGPHADSHSPAYCLLWSKNQGLG